MTDSSFEPISGDSFSPASRQAEKAAARSADSRALADGFASGVALQDRNGLLTALGEELPRLLSLLRSDDGVCLVGGQSVGIWASVLDPSGDRLSPHRPFTTSDIDYFGDLAAARRFADATGGTLYKPSADTMNSNSSALVRVPLGQGTVTVDFLHAIIGVERREIIAGTVEVEIPDGQGGVIVLSVMHPVLVMRSRIANMLSAATMRRDAISYNQARAAIEIVALWAERSIREGNTREAMRTITACVSHASADFYGRRALRELGLNQLDAVRRFVEDDRLDSRWRDRTLAARILECDRKRARAASRT